MVRRPLRAKSVRILALLALLASACSADSAGSGTGGPASATACSEGEFILSGTLDGQTVSAQGTVKGHAWEQLGSKNSLDASFDPTSSLHAEWASAVSDGTTTPITGSVTMPASTPHGCETLGSTSGILTKLGDEIRFEYGSLSVTVTCIAAPCPATPVSGSVEGCLHWMHIGP